MRIPGFTADVQCFKNKYKYELMGVQDLKGQQKVAPQAPNRVLTYVNAEKIRDKLGFGRILCRFDCVNLSDHPGPQFCREVCVWSPI